MPEIKVTKHAYLDNGLLHSHAHEDFWTGPEFILWIEYDGFSLELVLRRDGKGNWEAANVYHDDYFSVCPICEEQKVRQCKKAASYMDQLAEDALNHPSFRLIALFEM